MQTLANPDLPLAVRTALADAALALADARVAALVASRTEQQARKRATIAARGAGAAAAIEWRDAHEALRHAERQAADTFDALSAAQRAFAARCGDALDATA